MPLEINPDEISAEGAPSAAIEAEITRVLALISVRCTPAINAEEPYATLVKSSAIRRIEVSLNDRYGINSFESIGPFKKKEIKYSDLDMLKEVMFSIGINPSPFGILNINKEPIRMPKMCACTDYDCGGFCG